MWRRRLVRAARWLGLGLALAVGAVYLGFLFMAYVYVRDSFRYKGVESWPSVPVERIAFGGGTAGFDTGFYHGKPVSVSVDTRHVEYNYTVDGVPFRGEKVTPASRRPDYLQKPFRAYYDPGQPKIAVLVPLRYSSDALAVGMVFTGVLIAAHLFFTFKRYD